MTRLAEFVQSPAGRLYARTCAHYGHDPAAMFTDPLLAINARVGFAVVEMNEAEPEPDPARMVDGRMVVSGLDPLRG
jgi:hypothetical protein